MSKGSEDTLFLVEIFNDCQPGINRQGQVRK